MAVLPWMENTIGEPADVYFMSSLLYVCAKNKMISEAEKIFWVEIPSRNLTYTVATANSLMYMYAKLNRPDDALRVYELIKDTGLKCTVVTYGVLIKALMRSGKKPLQDTAFEVLKSLPNLGINAGVEVYNQIFEYYAITHNYKQTKAVLRLMSQTRPRVKLDAVSYGYLISCFADSKKPRSALSAFHQMRKQKMEPNLHTYMGVLKALAHMRDGLSAVQVIREMLDTGVNPDKKHYSMAMFACVISNQCSLAESIIALYLRQGLTPDTALCTLWLRALLQQGKWNEGNELFRRMKIGSEYPKPNQQTYNYLLQYQIMDRKWTDALDTLRKILNNYSSALNRVGMDGSMQGTFSALSFALGIYSSQVTRMYREDSGSQQYKHGLSSSNIIDDSIEISSEILTSFNTVDNLDASTLLTDVDETNDGTLLDDEKLKSQSSLYIETVLTKPSVDALTFVIEAVDLIRSYENIIIHSDFYIELLKSVILEGQPELARRLLHMRSDGSLRVKVDQKDKLSNIEMLANRAVKGGMIAQK